MAFTVADIFVNQIGYPVNAKKYAYVEFSGECENDDIKTFCLKDLKGNAVYEGNLSSAVNDELAGGKYATADFSNFTEAGKYILCCENCVSSSVCIGDDLYSDLYYSTLYYFYLSRCGEDTKDSVFGHSACHTGIAEIYGTKEKKKVLGGWHDAGDYGRYVVAGTKAVMDLLLAYENSKDSFTEFNILDEVRFELEWLLQMQREDGAVYHKISCYKFCAFIEPQKEKEQLVLAPVSTSATADFAGCLAFASKFYKDVDSEFAEKLILASKKAQDYLDTHEDELYTNPEEIRTGGYGDWNVRDERFFALCALFEVTQDQSYIEKAKKVRTEGLNLKIDPEKPWMRGWSEGFSWGNVTSYGTEILLRNKEKIHDKAFVAELEKAVIAMAEEILANVNKNVFGVSASRIFWGSNGQVCDLAHLLILAGDLTGNNEYYFAAERQIDYILGCNPMNVCYVTGNGINPVKNPHHRPSGALKVTMPGMLSGGPCAGKHDEIAKKYLDGKAPLKCFIDHQGSFSTNEIAIYWNSPFVYLMARLKRV